MTAAGEKLLDTQGMREAHASMPDQIERAATAARHLEGLPDHDWVEQIVVLGMGGSGIAGDVVHAVTSALSPVPITVVKNYELPAFVGEGTLAFAMSFSGNTEEVLESATEAAVQGAKVVAVTSGGELERLASGWGSPISKIECDVSQPRAALGALVTPPLVALERVGLFPGATQWIALALEQLRRRREVLLSDASPARDIARRIGRTLPVIHGGGALGVAAAQRWKTQVNENAKAPAFWSAQPELCHNEVVGWGQNGDVTRQVLSLVQLRHNVEHPQVERRHQLVGESMREFVADVIEVRAEGEGDLAQLLDLIFVGDFVSLVLGFAEGIDPGPISAIDELKSALNAH